MLEFAIKPLKNTKVEPCQCYCWQFFIVEPHFEVELGVEVHFLSLTLVSCCCVQMVSLQLVDICCMVIIVCCSYTSRAFLISSDNGVIRK